MAVYKGEACLFFEGIDPSLAGSIRLFIISAERSSPFCRMSAIVRGFTISAFRTDDLLIVAMLEGRLTPSPPVNEEEAEYLTLETVPGLPGVDEARRDAERFLRQLKMIDNYNFP